MTAGLWPAGDDDSLSRWLYDRGREMAWADRALCAEVGGDIFYPEQGGDWRSPRRICMACEVRAPCLAYALDHDEEFGIWGGMSAQQRARIRRQDRREAA